MRGTADFNRYCGACYPHCGEGRNPNPVNPSIGQAYAINEQGRQALTNREYDKAADLFRQAYATYPDPVYKQNLQLALSQKRSAVSQAHFDRGQSAYEASNWKLAIEEYQRSLTFAGPGDDTEAAKKNIRLAHFNQDMDWYRQMFKSKRYKEAALYLREANQWNSNPALAEDLKNLEIIEARDNGAAAYEAKDYAAAERLFARILALDPNSAYASRMRGNCITFEALKLAESAPIENVIAEFDRAFSAYSQGPKDSHLAASLSWARSQARFILAQLAKSPGDWNAVIAAHEAWANAPFADEQARKELARIRVARATNGTSTRTASGIQDAQEQFAAAVKADPENINARNGQLKADEQARKLADTRAIVHAMTMRSGGDSGSNGLKGLAGRQAKAAVAGGDCPWQTSKGCSDSPETSPVVVPSSGFAFASPREETPAQVKIHADINAKQEDNEKLAKQLAQTPDPYQRMKVKAQLTEGETELSEKKDEYVKAGKPHFIAPLK